ncbi:sodium:calcium antiporter [Candidatus Roizmanbacteria bacterium]|jgi:cation:H+ antiporter|nr:sodium:calcium antiporter [Candidatus Roizmanbacteria bacterium]
MAIRIILYLACFVFIWFGSGLIVRSVDKFSRRLKISSFAVSFFVLGILTSIPELAVGITSVVDRKPEIFVGNLIGGVIIIFLLIIPTLAILGNGIKLSHNLNKKNLLLSLLVVAAPAFLISDQKVTVFEGVLMVFLYITLFYFIEKKKGLIETVEQKFIQEEKMLFIDLFNVLSGIAIIFLSSNFIVSQTIYFSSMIKISPFFISLIILSLGTNLPELSVGIRSIRSGKKDIAFGDYIGSAAANTLFFGLLTLVNRGDITIPNHFLLRFVFIAVGLFMFYIFSRSKHDISRHEGLALLSVYVLFLLIEIFVR